MVDEEDSINAGQNDGNDAAVGGGLADHVNQEGSQDAEPWMNDVASCLGQEHGEFTHWLHHWLVNLRKEQAR